MLRMVWTFHGQESSVDWSGFSAVLGPGTWARWLGVTGQALRTAVSWVSAPVEGIVPLFVSAPFRSELRSLS